MPIGLSDKRNSAKLSVCCARKPFSSRSCRTVSRRPALSVLINILDVVVEAKCLSLAIGSASLRFTAIFGSGKKAISVTNSSDVDSATASAVFSEALFCNCSLANGFNKLNNSSFCKYSCLGSKTGRAESCFKKL